MEVNDFLKGANYRSLNNSRKRLKKKNWSNIKGVNAKDADMTNV